MLTLEDVTGGAPQVLAWGRWRGRWRTDQNPLTPIGSGCNTSAGPAGMVDFDRVFEQNVERILAESTGWTRSPVPSAGSAWRRRARRRSPWTWPPLPATWWTWNSGKGDIEWRVVGVDVPVHAFARGDELREVLLNVLENARQAGARTVTVRVVREGDRVELIASDDGDGVSPGDLSRIFEPRFSTRTSGSGLGLAISRGLVEAWGGRMDAQRAPGHGTEMRISLAAAPAP